MLIGCHPELVEGFIQLPLLVADQQEVKWQMISTN
jgi:hypothetical protein